MKKIEERGYTFGPEQGSEPGELELEEATKFFRTRTLLLQSDPSLTHAHPQPAP